MIYGISEVNKNLHKILIYSFSYVPQVYETSTSASSSHQKLSLHAEQATEAPRPESKYLPRKKRQVGFGFFWLCFF